MTRQDVVAALVAEFGSHRGVGLDEVLSKGKSKVVFEVRARCMRAARERFGWSYPEIGKAFNRDHTTVMSAIKAGMRSSKNEGRKVRAGLAEIPDLLVG